MSDDELANMFAGKKYWIAQRVPSRNHWIELLEKHGGHVVKLDTQADVLIADHARKGAPSGSLSWKFIEDSVKKGELQDPTEYPAGASVAPGQESAASSRPPGKMSRQAYTAEDDRQLWEWVTDAESKGVAISGNNLYKELQAINPRHTWQSWRDRWLKALAHRERPAGGHSNVSPQPGPAITVDPQPPSPQNAGRRRVPASSNSNSVRSPAVAAIPTASLARPSNSKPSRGQAESRSTEQEQEVSSPGRTSLADSAEDMQEPSTGRSFTDQDEDLLLSMSEEIEDIDPNRVIEAWEAFARTYPRHNGDEWRRFWDEVVRPSTEHHKSDLAKELRTFTPSSSKDSQAPTSSNPERPQEIVERLKTSKSQNEQEATLKELPDEECRERSEALVGFLANLETPVNFDVEEDICGDQILLYNVYRAITSAFDPELAIQRKGRWEEVARLLGINQSKSKISALKDKFSREIDQFFAHRDFLDIKRMEEETESDGGNGEESDEADYEGMPNSPTELPREDQTSAKRKRFTNGSKGSQESTTLENSVNKTPDASKRQRIDKGKGKELEIPSTPEAVYQPQRKGYQKFVQDPETQDFFFTQANHDGENSLHHTEPDSPSNQIYDEAFRASHHSPEPEPEPEPEPDSSSAEAYRNASQEKIDRYIALGYSKEVVRKGLAATSMNDQNAAVVMDNLTQGKGIPNNLPGVWTTEDDLALRDDVGGLEMMIKKHGSDRVDERIIWVEAVEATLREIRRGNGFE